jgi:hypothetical protein
VLERTIRALVPAGFLTAIIAHVFPFIDPSPGFHLWSLHSIAGIRVFSVAFWSGFYVLLYGPQILVFFGEFSCPLVLAFVGLVVHRRGWIGSVAALMAGALGFIGLALPYFTLNPLSQSGYWGYGYFAAECGFLIATLASAARLTGGLLGLGITGKPLPRRPQLPAHKWEVVSGK